MTKAKAPKYCKGCGEKLIVKQLESRYDEYTGKEIKVYRRYCPVIEEEVAKSEAKYSEWIGTRPPTYVEKFLGRHVSGAFFAWQMAEPQRPERIRAEFASIHTDYTNG